jgi:hypothetical protein
MPNVQVFSALRNDPAFAVVEGRGEKAPGESQFAASDADAATA